MPRSRFRTRCRRRLSGLRRLIIVVDNDIEGRPAALRLREEVEARGIVVTELIPTHGDFNDICVSSAATSSLKTSIDNWDSGGLIGRLCHGCTSPAH